MTHTEWLSADINTRLKRMEILVSMNNPLNDEQVEELQAEIYEREQELDALTSYE